MISEGVCLMIPSCCVLKQFIVMCVMINWQWLHTAGAVMNQLAIFQHTSSWNKGKKTSRAINRIAQAIMHFTAAVIEDHCGLIPLLMQNIKEIPHPLGPPSIFLSVWTALPTSVVPSICFILYLWKKHGKLRFLSTRQRLFLAILTPVKMNYKQSF